MVKKMIEGEKKWWTKNLAKTDEILRVAGIVGNHFNDYKCIFGDINLIFMKDSCQETYIRKSLITSSLKKNHNYRGKIFQQLLDNKWLFYKQEIEMGTDTLIQPIFNMEKINESKQNALIKAIKYKDYDKVQKLVPNEINRFNIYSNCLFVEEPGGSKDLVCHNDLSNPACDGSELTQKELSRDNERGTERDTTRSTERDTTRSTERDTTRSTERGTARTTARDDNPIISTRDAKEREREIEKENKSFNQNQSINKEPIVERTEPSCLIDCDKKIDFTDEIGLKSWKDYLDNLKLESKEAQCLLNYAYQDSAFFEKNFDKFKEKLWNTIQSRGKYKEQNLLSNFRKNGYIVNLLRNGNERNRLIEDIKRSQTFKIQTEFRHHREGYKWDLFNKDGDRMSGGRIIPRDAPPQPSPDHWWNYQECKWCI